MSGQSNVDYQRKLMYSSEHFTCFQDVEESREGLMSVSLEVDVTRLSYSSPAGRTMLPPLTKIPGPGFGGQCEGEQTCTQLTGKG